MINQESKRSEVNSEIEEATAAALSDVTEASSAESPVVVEATNAESPTVTNLNVRKAQRGGVNSKLSAGAGSNPRIPRELARLMQPDQFSRLVSKSGANLMIAGQTRGRLASRNPLAEGVRFHSEEGRRGSRSLSAEARRSGVVFDGTRPATKEQTVSVPGSASPRSARDFSQTQVAPATVPEGILTVGNAEKKIEELLNTKRAQHEALLRAQQAAHD